MKNLFILSLLAVFAFASCSKKSDKVSPKNYESSIVGKWNLDSYIAKSYEGAILVDDTTYSVKEGSYFSFSEDGTYENQVGFDPDDIGKDSGTYKLEETQLILNPDKAYPDTFSIEKFTKHQLTITRTEEDESDDSKDITTVEFSK